MEIVMIGSGNAATVLGKKFRLAGHVISQVYSRNPDSGKALAELLESEHEYRPGLLNGSADLYLVAVSDKAILEVCSGLGLSGKSVAHTAGSVFMHILKEITTHYGVFYPLQSLQSKVPDLPKIPFLYDGSDSTIKNLLRDLGESVSPGYVSHADDRLRFRLHMAAVMVNNFINHWYALAELYCIKENIRFGDLQPLIEETAIRLRTLSARELQTGPAIREDASTISTHLGLLSDHPHLHTLYRLMSESIAAFHSTK